MWTIVQEARKRYGCFAKVCWQALRIARAQKKSVKVRFLGAKRKNNRDIHKTDFMIDGKGNKNPKIDPTWWAHGK